MFLTVFIFVFIDLSNFDSKIYEFICSLFNDTCPDFYDMLIWDYSVAFAILTASFLIDLSVRGQIASDNKNRLYKNLKGDFQYNRLVNKEVNKVFGEDVINVAHNMYATDGIREFIYQTSLNDSKNKYEKDLFNLLLLLESSNRILHAALLRSDSGRHVIIGNSVKSNTTAIEMILDKIISMNV